MEEIQNKNFSIEYNTRLPSFIAGKKQYVACFNGKIKTVSVTCPLCGRSTYVDNGYHTVENSFVLALGLNIKIAQYECKTCGTHWSTNRELIDQVIQKEKYLVKSLLLGCARAGLSFEKASALVEDKIGVRYSTQYVYELYASTLDEVKQERFSSASGVYEYDEQYLVENAKEVCRLTLKDAVTGKVLLDQRAVDAGREVIKRALREALKGLPAEAFIVDMRSLYPDVISELFPHAKIQLCIFHLDKLIWKEFHDEFGKNVPLFQLYNAYTLFDLFFDHSFELKKLTELLKKLDRYKGNDAKENKEVECCLREEFGRFVKALKKERRREHKRVPRRTLKQSENRLKSIKQQVQLYPKKLQHRIQFIEEHWDKFTLFQRDSRVQPTTNGIEHYFAATLAKTEKKDFRSKGAVIRELKACQAEWNGAELFQKTKLVELLSLVGLLFLAFPP